MKYKLKNPTQPMNAETCLREILLYRGVEDINAFLNPTDKCELNPFNLDNIEKGAKMLLFHLYTKSHICFIVD